MATFSPGQLKALAVVPKFSSALSLLGSGWIIMEVVRDPRKRAMVYHRLLLAFSVGDVVLSCAYFSSTWPIPAGTPGVYGARGTKGTCTAQGFFIQVGGVTTLYAAFISVYHLLVVRYRWSEERARSLETFVLTVTLLFAFATAFACLAMGLFNFAQFWCWIAPPPDRPDMSVSAYRFAFLYVWLWIGLAVVTWSMFLLYWTVRGQVRRMRRYSTLAGVAGANNRRLVATQAMLYVFAFYSIGTFNTLTRIIQAINGEVYFPIVLAMVIFTPLQGFWNLIIYLRPRYLRYREDNPNWSKMHVIHRTLHRAVARNSSSSVRVSGSAAAGGGGGGGDPDLMDDGDHMLGVVMESGGGDDDENTKSPTAVSIVEDGAASATSSYGNDPAETGSMMEAGDDGPVPRHSRSMLHRQQPRRSSPSAITYPSSRESTTCEGGNDIDEPEHDRDGAGVGGRVAAHLASGTFQLRSTSSSSSVETRRRATTGGITISSDPRSSRGRGNRGRSRGRGDGRLSLRTLSQDENDDAHRLAVFVGMDGNLPSPEPTTGGATRVGLSLGVGGDDATDLSPPPTSPAIRATTAPTVLGVGGGLYHRSRDDGGRMGGNTARAASSPPSLDVRINMEGGRGRGGHGGGRKCVAVKVEESEDRAAAAAYAAGTPSCAVGMVSPATTTEAKITEDEALRLHHRRWPLATSPAAPRLPSSSGDIRRGEDDHDLGRTGKPEQPEPHAAATAAPVPAEASEVTQLDQMRQPDHSVEVETTSVVGESDNEDYAHEGDEGAHHRVRARAA